ncbi:MAG: hypothetical protein P8I39_00935, partial [Akkermansiaceae bacterium]|nr:hypothetical protein [Akkermansiaceae bacterium]
MRPVLVIFLLLSSGHLVLGAPLPNIIVYFADDMGLGDTSVYQDWCDNNEKVQLHTPNMQRLANMGIRFT